jgi:tRNA uridine 5-carboxymethylaminomethyl modification enzyme
MFTSRAEHRLHLRIDNADLRLTPRGREIGLVDDHRWAAFEERRERLLRNEMSVRATSVIVGGQRIPASRALRQPEVALEALIREKQLSLDISNTLDLVSLETGFRYAGYLERQQQSIDRLRRQESKEIPRSFVYAGIPGLSREMVERLTAVRPQTLAQAQRVPGVTPAAVALIAAHIGSR